MRWHLTGSPAAVESQTQPKRASRPCRMLGLEFPAAQGLAASGSGWRECSPTSTSACLRVANPRRAGPRSERERLENLHPHFNIRMGRELGGAPDAQSDRCVVGEAVACMGCLVGCT